MIYHRLNRVRNGQRLSVELVNGLIKRTEYAADLLIQYKPLAGTDISVAQRYDGTTISGGVVAIGPYRLSGTSFLNSQNQVLVYDGNNFERFSIPDSNNNEQIGLDIEKEKVCGYFLNALINSATRFDPFLLDINTGIFDYSRPQPFKPFPVPDEYDCFFHGISNNIVVGLYEDWFYGGCGIIYQNGSLLKTIYPLPPGQEPASYSASNETEFFGIYENTIVG